MVEKTYSSHSSARKKVAKHAIKKHTTVKAPPRSRKKKVSLWPRVRTAVSYLLIVLVSFIVAEVVVNLLIYAAIAWLHIPLLSFVSEAVVQLIMSLLVYVMAFMMAVYLGAMLFKERTTLNEVGLLQMLPRWRDIGLAPLVFVAYNLVAVAVIQIISQLIPSLIDLNQQQAIGFSNVTTRYELIAAYITLTIMAPFAEELLFRGFLFGKLRKHLKASTTIMVTALLFASLHLIGIQDNGQIQLQWAVLFDTFILAIALGILRERTGSIWAGILLHVIKNSLAFFFLFVAPLLDITIPGL